MSDQHQIDDFLKQKRIAVVGVSHDPHDFSRTVFADLRKRGYDAVPVNLHLNAVDGIPAVPSVAQADPPVGAAYIITHPTITLSIVEQCRHAGIEHVWLHRGQGHGSGSDAALAYGKTHCMNIISGECIEMFLSEPEWIHRWHRSFRKLTGQFPT